MNNGFLFLIDASTGKISFFHTCLILVKEKPKRSSSFSGVGELGTIKLL